MKALIGELGEGAFRRAKATYFYCQSSVPVDLEYYLWMRLPVHSDTESERFVECSDKEYEYHESDYRTQGDNAEDCRPNYFRFKLHLFGLILSCKEVLVKEGGYSKRWI